MMDLALPDCLGFEVLAALVPIHSKPTVPVLVLTLLVHRTMWELVARMPVFTRSTRGARTWRNRYSEQWSLSLR